MRGSWEKVICCASHSTSGRRARTCPYHPKPKESSLNTTPGRLDKCLLRTGRYRGPLCLIHLRILRRTWPFLMMASKKRWVCWAWTMLPKFVEAKDEVDVGHTQERTSVGSIWIQPKTTAWRRQATWIASALLIPEAEEGLSITRQRVGSDLHGRTHPWKISREYRECVKRAQEWAAEREKQLLTPARPRKHDKLTAVFPASFLASWPIHFKS